MHPLHPSIRPCLLLLLTCILCTCGPAQQVTSTSFPEFPTEAVKASLETHRQPSITTRRFKQSDLQPLLNALPAEFAVDTAGRSVEDRPLWRVVWGEGGLPVLLWSQMHGDEPTATAALFDLFSWLQGSGDGLDSLRNLLNDNLQLTFLPMLNPDGAQVFERRNALGIDLNRDALRLTSPESRLLKQERDRLDAAWGFNLHDQGIYYSAGFPAEKGCVLSILAPAFDWEKTMSPKREDATQLIALMNDLWQDEVPGQVGRYNDDFEPRAFGDNLQKWGTRTILIESGGYPGDPEKQNIRRLNVLALIAGLHGIATGRYEAYSVDDYWEIPENQSSGMHDLILENGILVRPDGEYRMDIGYRHSERTTGPEMRDFSRSAYISDVGDLHTFGAFERVDLEGMTIQPGKVYPGKLSNSQLSEINPVQLYQDGYTSVAVESATTNAPLDGRLRILTGNARSNNAVEPGSATDLLIYDASGNVVMAVIEGRLIKNL